MKLSTKIFAFFLLLIIVLIVRYYILLQYVKVKKIQPPKDGTLCPDIFELYENEHLTLTIPNKAYSAIPSYYSQKTDDATLVLSVKNDGVLDYRVNGVLVWSSENSGKVAWTQDVKNLHEGSFDIEERCVTQSTDGKFCLTLAPFAIYHRPSIDMQYKKIWDLEGWESSFRPTDPHPSGNVFLMSENRNLQVALLSNGDLIALEKTSLLTPHKVKTSLLESYCDDD